MRMSTKLIGRTIAIALLLSIGGCGPSEEELRQAEEEKRIEQERRQEEIARQQEQQKAAREAAAARAREREAAAASSAQDFLDRAMNDPSVKPRKYYRALESITATGDMLVLTISITDKDEAVKLCNMMGAGWWEREERGIRRIVVKHSGDGSTLAQLTKLSTGAEVCR